MTEPSTTPRLDALLQTQQRQPVSYQPPHDGWPALQKRLVDQHKTQSQSQRVPAWWHWLVATAAVLVVAVTVFSANHYTRTAEPANQLLVLLSTLESHQQQQRELVRGSFQQVGYNPASTVVDTEVAQLQQAAELVATQLRRDPNNQALWEMLQWLHQQELQLLRDSYQRSVTWYDV